MKDMTSHIKQADHDVLVKMVINSFRNILFHYGQWYAQVEHQLGMEKGNWK